MSKRAATPVRFDPAVADRLASFVAANPGMSLSSAANRLVDEFHAGLILVSTKTFPQNRGFPSAITASLTTLLGGTAKIQSGQVLLLARG